MTLSAIYAKAGVKPVQIYCKQLFSIEEHVMMTPKVASCQIGINTKTENTTADTSNCNMQMSIKVALTQPPPKLNQKFQPDFVGISLERLRGITSLWRIEVWAMTASHYMPKLGSDILSPFPPQCSKSRGATYPTWIAKWVSRFSSESWLRTIPTVTWKRFVNNVMPWLR